MKLNDEFVGEFVEFCEYQGTDPEEAARFLNAQDWEAGKEHIGKFSEEQLKAMNRLTSQIVGEPTIEQLKEMLRSVMMDAVPALTVAN